MLNFVVWVILFFYRYSALRASELGDGTLEVREVKDAVEWIQLMKDNAGITMNSTCFVLAQVLQEYLT